MSWTDIKPLDLSKINSVDYPEDRYFREKYDKTQICLHHTVSGPGIRGDIKTWLANKYRVATCIIIDRDGTPNQLFSSRYWGYHTGKGKRLDKASIGIELDNWGPLIKGDGNIYNFGSDKNPKFKVTEKDKYYAVYGNKVDVPVTYYKNGFRGYNYYESYPTEQLQTVGELLLYWNNVYGIPLDYKEDMWDVTERALRGDAGVWSHTSYRPAPEKFDCHPQPELIELLKQLNDLI